MNRSGETHSNCAKPAPKPAGLQPRVGPGTIGSPTIPPFWDPKPPTPFRAGPQPSGGNGDKGRSYVRLSPNPATPPLPATPCPQFSAFPPGSEDPSGLHPSPPRSQCSGKTHPPAFLYVPESPQKTLLLHHPPHSYASQELTLVGFPPTPVLSPHPPPHDNTRTLPNSEETVSSQLGTIGQLARHFRLRPSFRISEKIWLAHRTEQRTANLYHNGLPEGPSIGSFSLPGFVNLEAQ